MQLNLMIFDSDASNLAELKSVFSGMSTVTIQKMEVMRYLRPPNGIDILYLPLAATERWGTRPLIHESQIIKTSLSERENGLPAYIVTGTLLAPDDVRDPISEMTILLDAVFNAIRSFNSRNKASIRRVGFWGYDILRGLTPTDLRAIISQIAPELGSSLETH
jgi:hypothetical protein